MCSSAVAAVVLKLGLGGAGPGHCGEYGVRAAC